MKLKLLLSLAMLTSVATFASCSGNGALPPANTPKPAASPTPAPTPHTPAGDEVPAEVRAAFPTAQSITIDHKPLSDDQIKHIETDAGAKVADHDHHAYLAFATTGGARKQVGAATVVDAAGTKLVVVYESRNGLPYITEVRGEAIPADLLGQFKGKGHDDAIQIGKDLKAGGFDEAKARAISDAIRVDTRVMQALYGSAHSH